MMQRFLLFSFVCFFIASCEKSDLPNSVTPSTGVLNKVITFGGSLNDVGQAIIATSDGGFAVLGHTQSMDGDITDKDNTSFDFWLLKFDADANLIWSETFGGSGNDRGRDLIQTPDGGFVVIGYSNSTDGDLSENFGLRDFWLAKISPTGTLVWQKSFGFPGADEGLSIQLTNDNHFLISGVLDVTASGGDGNTGRNNQRHAGGDYWVLKVSNTGDLVWSRYYGGSFTDTPFQTVTDNSNILIAGSSDSKDVDISNNKGSYDFWVVKTDDKGAILWERSFGGSEIDEARGVMKTQDGHFLIIGDTRSNDKDVSQNFGAADVWLFKMNTDGEMLWSKNYGGTNFDVARAINPTFDGGAILSGSSRSSDGQLDNNKGQNDAWIVKVDHQGNLKWQLAVGGSEIDFAYDAVELSNGSIIAVGESNSSNGDVLTNKGFSDLLIIKLD